MEEFLRYAPTVNLFLILASALTVLITLRVNIAFFMKRLDKIEETLDDLQQRLTQAERGIADQHDEIARVRTRLDEFLDRSFREKQR